MNNLPPGTSLSPEREEESLIAGYMINNRESLNNIDKNKTCNIADLNISDILLF